MAQQVANIFGSLHRVAEYLHEIWPHTVIELRGDSNFCSHEFMDWAKTRLYVRFTTGLSGNPALMRKIGKQLRRAKDDYERHKTDICRYYSFDYKAKSWEYSQRVIAKIEVTGMGVYEYSISFWFLHKQCKYSNLICKYRYLVIFLWKNRLYDSRN